MKKRPNPKTSITLRHNEWITVLRCMHVAIDPKARTVLRASELAMESVSWSMVREQLLQALSEKVAARGGAS